MGWRLRGASVGWCCVILMSTAGTDRVGSTGALPEPPDRPPASVTQPDWRPPVRTEAARRASTTTVSSAVHRGEELEVAEPLLQAYRTAAQLVSPGCHLPVSLLAAIGQVESGNLRDRRLDVWHRAVPRVYGPVLDGRRFSRVPDTDGGVLDGNRRWDRAVGPMQFLPSTWIAYAVDLDGDGRLDPQDVEDAAGSAAVYLCQSGGDLADPASLQRAVLTYNHSLAYLRLVLAWMAAYDEAGLTAGTALATLPAVLVDPGARRVVTAAAGSTARQKARVRGAASKHHAKAVVAGDPVRTQPTKPGRDPVRPGGAWSPGPGEPPPGEELPPCEVDPPVTDPVTGLPTTDPPTTDPPTTDPVTEPPAVATPAPASPSTEPTTGPTTGPTSAPTPAPTPGPDPSDPPVESCLPQTPGDPATPVDPATGTDPTAPDEPPPVPCGACVP